MQRPVRCGDGTKCAAVQHELETRFRRGTVENTRCTLLLLPLQLLPWWPPRRWQLTFMITFGLSAISVRVRLIYLPRERTIDIYLHLWKGHVSTEPTCSPCHASAPWSRMPTFYSRCFESKRLRIDTFLKTDRQWDWWIGGCNKMLYAHAMRSFRRSRTTGARAHWMNVSTL